MSNLDILWPATQIETAHLGQILEQYIELLQDSIDEGSDPTLKRLTPKAYLDDDAAQTQFARLTSGELLIRRRDDALTALKSLGSFANAATISESDETFALSERTIALNQLSAHAWIRTLSSLRLVFASRLGILEDENIPADVRIQPRYAVYEWLGYRLEGLIETIESETDGASENE